MNHILLYLFLALSVEFTYQQNRTDRVNEGASTSRQDLRDLENWEISGYAEKVISLMMAEDKDGGDLSEMMNNDFDALQAFHDEIFSYILLAEHSSKPYYDAFRRARRLDLMGMHMTMHILQVMITTCNEHYRDRLWYEYDREKNVILLRENLSFSSDDACLCENYRERSTLSTTLSLPEYVGRSERTYQCTQEGSNLSKEEATQYYIIPLPLISKFFQVWLADEPINFQEDEDLHLNSCALTLIGRLKRSMQKLVIARLKSSREFSYQNRYKIEIDVELYENDTFSVDLLSHADNWLNGNIFLGPSNRGPFDPNFNKSSEESLTAFEVYVAPIIGQSHYKKIVSLYTELRSFVRTVGEMDPVERIIEGFNLFFSMTILMNEYGLTLMNLEQWEERGPTDEELTDVKDENLKRELKNEKFWAIKRDQERPQRDTGRSFDSRIEPVEKRFYSLEQSKYRWSKFVMKLMELSLTARKQAPAWLCNFTQLYNDYLFNYANVKENNSFSPVSFDQFLYSKISRSIDWRRCVQLEELTTKKKWCLAWRRVIAMPNTPINISGNRYEFAKRFASRGQIIMVRYSKDIEVLMDWLIRKIKFKKCDKNESGLLKLPHISFRVKKKMSGFLDLSLFQVTTFVTAVIAWDECLKIFGRS